MRETELRKAMNSGAILLVGPRELEPEVTLRDRGRCIAARDEDPQRRIPVCAELMHTRLQGAELFPSAA